MRPSSRQLNWAERLLERVHAVEDVLGPTAEHNEESFRVTPFDLHKSLPGACAMMFGPDKSGDFLYLTLGLSQPLKPSAQPFPWELAVRTNEYQVWPCDLLHQMLVCWIERPGEVEFGALFPLAFAREADGRLWANLTSSTTNLNIVGDLRWLFLWTDHRRLTFQTSSGPFKLLSAIGVTDDEFRAAQATSPTHLMLLFKRLGIDQVVHPFRPSAFASPDTPKVWSDIASLSYADALKELQ